MGQKPVPWSLRIVLIALLADGREVFPESSTLRMHAQLPAGRHRNGSTLLGHGDHKCIGPFGQTKGRAMTRAKHAIAFKTLSQRKMDPELPDAVPFDNDGTIV